MIIKCKEPTCDFRFISKKDRLNELITEKEEHEFLTKHKCVFLIALGSKLIEKENPEKVIKCTCTTCAENNGLFVIYETISNLDANRFVSLHNTTMAKKEKKLYQEHLFDFAQTSFDNFAREMRENSPVLTKMRVDDIKPEDVNVKEKHIKVGDQDLAFFLKESDAMDIPTRIAWSIYRNQCPFCNCDVDQNDKKYDVLLVHFREFHNTKININLAENIVVQCIIFRRNRDKIHRASMIDRKKRVDKESQALRTLNKTGIPAKLLELMFNLDWTRVSNLTYRGMELLGKPNWVKNVEANSEHLYNGLNLTNPMSKENIE